MTLNYDPEELAKFDALAMYWWDVEGELKTLHQLNPLRISYISEKIELRKQRILDVGCGGGILTEALAKQGAHVTGIDLNQSLIDVAKLHLLETNQAETSPLAIEYLKIDIESLASERALTYDSITCLEMLEHVPNPRAIIHACAKLIKPGGSLFFSTINRNLKAYIFAIIGGEYLLRLLPKNTHDYRNFIRPKELSQFLREAKLCVKDIKGISYHLYDQTFTLSNDISVNYLLYAIKPT